VKAASGRADWLLLLLGLTHHQPPGRAASMYGAEKITLIAEGKAFYRGRKDNIEADDGRIGVK